MAPDLSAQLAAVFSAGLNSDPSLRDSLAEALARDESYTKAEVNYRKGDENGKCCGTCSHYRADRGARRDGGFVDSSTGACDIVAGTISATSVSDKYNRADDDSRGRPVISE